MNINRQLFFTENFFSRRGLVLFLMFAVLPNLVGLIILPNVFGLKIHFFQYFIFLSAIVLGPLAGALTGIFGSVHVALALNNPFVLVGNAILGFFTGLLAKRIGIMKAALAAYCIQLPWLIYSDIFLAGMPAAVVQMIIVSLLVSNILLGFAALKTFPRIKRVLA